MAIEPKQPIVAPVRTVRPPAKRVKPSIIVIIVLAVLAAASTGVAIYYFAQYQDLAKNPNKLVDNENKALINRVGALMVLPTDETPTIATITDLAPFKGQPFFANAKVGFKVIIYTNAKRAILYDPALNKIVEVAPLNIGSNTPAPAMNANTNAP